LRKKGYNINDIMDRIIEEEYKNTKEDPNLESELP
jgi:hypothetical protein